MRVILLKPSGQRLQLTWSEHSGVNKNSIHQTGVYIEVVCRQHIIIRIQTGTDSVISPTLILKNSQVDICLRAQVKVQYQKGTLHELININAAITDGIIDNLLYICSIYVMSMHSLATVVITMEEQHHVRLSHTNIKTITLIHIILYYWTATILKLATIVIDYFTVLIRMIDLDLVFIPRIYTILIF